MADINEQRSVTTIFTNAGQKLAAQLIANKNTAKFTHGEISTTDLFNESVTDLQVLNSLDNVQQEATLAEVIIMDKSTVRVQLAIDQTKAPNDYQMRTVGLYAKPADGDEILYSVTVMKDPIYVHQDASGSSLGLNLDTIVGQSANVTIEVNPAGAVTNEALKVTLKDYVQKSELDALLPADIAETGKANAFTGQNSFAQAPTDGNGNPYITGKDAQAKVDAGVKTAASDAATKATAAQTAAEKYTDGKTIDSVKWGDQVGGRNLIIKNGEVAGFLNDEGTMGVQDKNQMEKLSDYIAVNPNMPYCFSYMVKLSAEQQSWYGIGLFDKDKKFIKRYAAIVTTADEDEIVSERHWLLPLNGSNGVVGDIMTTDTAYVRVSYRAFNDGHAKFELGPLSTDWTPAPEDMASKSDVANYQHIKLTADDGSAEYMWQDDTQDFTALIKSLPMGVHTFFATGNMKNNPVGAGQSVRGFIHIVNPGQVGDGSMINISTGDTWSIGLAVGVLTFAKLASDAGSKSYTDAQLEAAVKKVLGETVRDNGDGSVTFNGVRMVPADTAHVITVNDAGTAQAANFDVGTLTVDQLEVLGFKVMYDTDDYMTWAAAHPNALLIVLHKATS